MIQGVLDDDDDDISLVLYVDQQDAGSYRMECMLRCSCSFDEKHLLWVVIES